MCRVAPLKLESLLRAPPEFLSSRTRRLIVGMVCRLDHGRKGCRSDIGVPQSTAQGPVEPAQGCWHGVCPFAITRIIGEQKMNAKSLGIDCIGKWSPQQYALDAGWNFSCVLDTAEKGVRGEDADRLTPEQQTMLVLFCQDRRSIHQSGEFLRAFARVTGRNCMEAVTLWNEISQGFHPDERARIKEGGYASGCEQGEAWMRTQTTTNFPLLEAQELENRPRGRVELLVPG
jgi:hypothetical protein